MEFLTKVWEMSHVEDPFLSWTIFIIVLGILGALGGRRGGGKV